MAFTPTGGNYPVIYGYYPDAQYVHMAIGGLARPASEYSSAQVYVWNLSTGWSSGWYYTPPFSVSGGTTSAFPIYMTPGFTYEVQFQVLWNGTWWISSATNFYFQPGRPTNAPYVTFSGSSGRRLTFYVQDMYGATSIGVIGHTTGTDYFYGTGSNSITADAYGTEYYVGFKGYNSSGESSRVSQWVTTEPQLPALSNGGRLANGNQQININPYTGGWTTIQVEMWNAAENVHYATRTQGWNGGSPFSVEFGAMAPNTNYKFRVKAFKTSSNSSYHPESGWSSFYTFTYSVVKPTRWDWYTEKASNGLYSMSAAEWNAFALRINAFRKYKGLTDYAFSNAYSGSAFRYFMQNEARASINEMATTGIGTVTSGSPVTASELNILRNTLNVIQ